jgi:hypothetical protein
MNQNGIETRLLRTIVTPPRRELYTIDPSQLLEDVIRAALMRMHDTALSAWDLAIRQAVSPREFYVAAGGIILDVANRQLSVVYGYNIKLSEGDAPNLHAEDLITAQLELYGGALISLAVCGNLQPDDGTGLELPALAPCSKRCAPRLKAHRDTLTSTVLMGINPGTGDTFIVDSDELEQQYTNPGELSVFTAFPEENSSAVWQSKVAGEIERRVPQLAEDVLQHFLISGRASAPSFSLQPTASSSSIETKAFAAPGQHIKPLSRVTVPLNDTAAVIVKRPVEDTIHMGAFGLAA